MTDRALLPDLEGMIFTALQKSILLDPRRSRSDVYQIMLESLEKHNASLSEPLLLKVQAWRDGEYRR